MHSDLWTKVGRAVAQLDAPEAHADPPIDALIDALLELAERVPVSVVTEIGRAIVVQRGAERAVIEVPRVGPYLLRLMCVRIATRIAEVSGVEPPLYGGRGVLASPAGVAIELETSNRQRTGYWVLLHRARLLGAGNPASRGELRSAGARRLQRFETA